MAVGEECEENQIVHQSKSSAITIIQPTIITQEVVETLKDICYIIVSE